MAPPEPLDAPEMLPVIVPSDQLNELGVLAVSVMPVPVPLQIDAVVGFVTLGEGFTVTVIVVGNPVHEPVEDTGVTIYCTVPDVELLRLVRI